MSTPKIGVLLAGCGYLDGSEIHEAVLTLLYLDQAGAEALCMAPDTPQAHVVDHQCGSETAEERNVLTEAARIARGKILALSEVNPGELDALIIPGGFGVAKNLCTFAFDGTGMSVREDVARLVQDMHEAGKPIGAWCIAPALIAKLLPGITLTIGDDADTAGAVESLGAQHQACTVGNIIVDADRRIVTTPAYMLGPWIADIARGIEQGVQELISMLRTHPAASP